LISYSLTVTVLCLGVLVRKYLATFVGEIFPYHVLFIAIVPVEMNPATNFC